MNQIIQGYAYIYEKGLIHRDLKLIRYNFKTQ